MSIEAWSKTGGSLFGICHSRDRNTSERAKFTCSGSSSFAPPPRGTGGKRTEGALELPVVLSPEISEHERSESCHSTKGLCNPTSPWSEVARARDNTHDTAGMDIEMEMTTQPMTMEPAQAKRARLSVTNQVDAAENTTQKMKNPQTKPKPKSKAKAKPKSAAAPKTKRSNKLIWRTRDLENSALYNLQLDVSSLQSELQGLQQFRSMLMSRAMNRSDDLDGSFVKIVREYFRVFRNGYTDGDATHSNQHDLQHQYAALTHGSHSHSFTDGVASPDEFVRRVMDENVVIGRFCGLEQMMKQWQRYSSVLGPIQLSFIDSEIISTFRGSGEGQQQLLVTSRAQYNLYISLRTIEIMFPHLLPCHEIVQKILGRRISGVGKFDFVFNTADNRIVKYEFRLDFMASFIALLGDPATVARLLKDALISDEFFIGDLSEFVPERGVLEEEPDREPSDTTSAAYITTGTTAAGGGGSWKMTISSLLCSSDGDDDGVDHEPHAEADHPWKPRFEQL